MSSARASKPARPGAPGTRPCTKVVFTHSVKVLICAVALEKLEVASSGAFCFVTRQAWTVLLEFTKRGGQAQCRFRPGSLTTETRDWASRLGLSRADEHLSLFSAAL